MAEAFFLADGLQFRKDIGVDELNHRKVFGGRLQVLSQGDDLTSNASQVVHGLHHFVEGLAQAEHHPTLGAEASV